MPEEEVTETVVTPESETQDGKSNTEPKKLTPEEALERLTTAEKRIKELNAESAKHRKEAERLSKQEEERKRSELSETEKLKADNEKLKAAAEAAEARANERLVRSEILASASKLGFADPSDAVALLDKSALQVKDDGTVDGVESALKDLLKAKPHLAKRNGAAISPTNPNNSNGSGETDAMRRKRLGLA